MGKVIKSDQLASRPPSISPEKNRIAAELLETQRSIADLRHRARDQLIELALELTRRIVGRAVALDPQILESTYAQALNTVPDVRPATLFVHPDDRKRLDIAALARDQRIEVVDDPAVGQGGCRVRADRIEVDATLSTALDALRDALKETVHD